MMTNFLMLMLYTGYSLSPSFNVVVPDVIFNVDALFVSESHYYILDKGAGALAKIDGSGNLIAFVEGKGEGPGKFFIPRTLAVGNGIIYVGDFQRLHLFDENLNFIKQASMVNNPVSLVYQDGSLYAGTNHFPDGVHGIYVYDREGRFDQSFYEHQLGPSLSMPYLAMDGKDTLFVLDRIGYNISILKSDGRMVRTFPIKVSPRYKPYVSPEPYTKKFGYTLAASKHWRSQWSEPAGVKVVNQRFLMVCFKELEGLLTLKYYIDVYDLINDSKIINWKEVSGSLLFGDGNYAYFVEEENTNDSNYRNFITAYKIGSNPNGP